VRSGGDRADHSVTGNDAASDEALAFRVQSGDRGALEQLVRRYLRPIRGVAASYVQEPADIEDVVQETFLRTLRAIETWDPRRPFAPWLYQIARNVARNHVAARARSPVDVPLSSLPSDLPGPDGMLERSQIRARIARAIAELPDRRRTAFQLSDVEGYDVGEVARIMGLSPGTVRSHIHHARSALRTALADTREQLGSSGG